MTNSARNSLVNAFYFIHDHGFAIIFAAIVVLAATPNAFEFWQKMKRTHNDTQLKLAMLKTGYSADQIVRTLLRQDDSDSTIQRAA
jgi:hypothetical protein